MDYTVEFVVFMIIVLIIFGQPSGLMDLGNTTLGRAMLLSLIVVLSLKSQIGGLLGALLLIILSENVLEGMTSEKEKDEDGKDKKDDKKDKKDGKKDDKKDKKDDKKDDKQEKFDLMGLTEKFSKLQELASTANKH